MLLIKILNYIKRKIIGNKNFSALSIHTIKSMEPTLSAGGLSPVVLTGKLHVVRIPFPAQGHINPFMQLAKLLHSRGFHITFLNTEFNQQRLLRSNGSDSLNGCVASSLKQYQMACHLLIETLHKIFDYCVNLLGKIVWVLC